MKKIIFSLFFLTLVASLAWSPWVNKSFVREKITANQKNEGVLKGCLLELGDSSRSLFGATTTVQYRCTQSTGNETGSSFKIQKAKLFISAFGTVHYLKALSQ